MNNRYISTPVIILTLILSAIGGLYWYGVREENAEKTIFVSELGNLSTDSNNLERISIFQVENLGGGSFNINGDVTNPTADKYYTIKPVQFNEFASSTDLSTEQINTLTSFAQKHPYIEKFETDTRILGKCGANSTTDVCVAIEFYLRQSVLTLWFSNPATWYSNGYMYIPFVLTESNQAYLDRYFSSLKEIAPNWYEFSGKHI